MAAGPGETWGKITKACQDLTEEPMPSTKLRGAEPFPPRCSRGCLASTFLWQPSSFFLEEYPLLHRTRLCSSIKRLCLPLSSRQVLSPHQAKETLPLSGMELGGE